MRKKDMYNQSGCLDLTPYYAMKMIEREKRKNLPPIRYARYFEKEMSHL